MDKKKKKTEQRLTHINPNAPKGYGNPPTKTDSATRAQRINTIAELILQGARRSQINAFLAKTETWHPDNPTPDPDKVAIRTVDLYMQEARAGIVEAASKKRDYLLAKALEQYDDLYNKSYRLQDYKNCRQIIRDRNELMGFHRIEARVTKTTHNIDYSKYSFEQLKELMQAARGLPGEQFQDIDHEEMPTAE